MTRIICILAWCILPAGTALGQAPNNLWTRSFEHGNLFVGKTIFALQDTIVCFGVASEEAPSFGQKAVIYLVTTCGDSISAHEFSRLATTTGSQMIKLANGGFAITGPGEELPPTSNDDFLLEIVSPLYESELVREFDTGDIDIAFGIVETTDGGYLITGYGFYPTKSWALRLSPSGDSLWSYSQDSTYLFGQAMALANTEFLVTGSGIGYANLSYLSDTGDLRWERRLDQTYIKWGKVLSDSTILVAGSKDGNGWAACFSLYGDTIWTNTYMPVDYNGISSGLETEEGRFRLAGSSAAHPVLLEIDGLGNELWHQVYNDIPSAYVTSMSMNAGNTTLGGYQNDGGTNKMWVGHFGARAPLPFLDKFDSSELEPCWSWIREDTMRWSLTERPGWVRIVTDGELHWNRQATNLLTRTFTDTDFVFETKVEMIPEPCTGAGITVYKNDSEFIDIVRQFDGVRSHNESFDSPQWLDLSENWDPCYLKIEKRGDVYRTFAGPDSLTWTLVATWHHPLSTNGNVKVNLGSFDCDHSIHIPADFDYVRVDPLPGTQVCGNVSGVWDSTGSPYYVTCDLTVPADQTLEIQPDVEVLFTGHYKFNVFGNLQAIGTEQDSIVFTRAFPTEESKWWHILVNSSDTCRFDYCLIEYGKATSPDLLGGGIFSYGTPIEILHCTFQYNYADDDGGAVRIDPSPYARISHCAFINNSASNALGAVASGALTMHSDNSSVDFCTFAFNNAVDRGGGLVVAVYSCVVENCTFYGNTALDGSAVYLCCSGNLEMSNCIVSNNLGGSEVVSEVGTNLVITFSNIAGGFPGVGNIDTDPLFVNAANGDFHLHAGSPCIDSGDPNSPIDPDGSRTDMGAFPYSGPRFRLTSPNGGETWTLLDSAVVQWIATGFDGSLMIEINRDYPAGEWDTLAFDAPNDSSETVFVEEPISDHCRVRVSSLETSFADVSNADFAIVPSSGYLALVRPTQPNTAVLAWNAGTMECPSAILESFRLKNFGSASINVFRPEESPSAEFSRVTACPSSFTLAPGQVSACDLTLSFTPESDGSYRDSLRIRTNASNGLNGALWIPLTGSQVTTPAAPEVTITVQGDDALLRWSTIVESIGECPITATGYLVFYSPTQAGPFYYHGFTTDTSYIHTRVVHYNFGMFYHVYATIEPLMLLSELPDFDSSRLMIEEGVLGVLRRQGVSLRQVTE